MADALELDALWEDFHRVVNMTSAELADWLRVRDSGELTEPLPDDAGPPLGQHVLAILQKRRADLTVRIYPGARHEVFNETNRAEVFADVTRFLDGVLAR